MRSLRNKVILSGIVLLFAFMATVGSTYAWFTVSSQAEVESFDLTVSAQDNLLIQVDDGYTAVDSEVTTIGNYSSTVTLAEILATTAYADLQSFKLQPVTAIQSGYASVDGKVLSVLTSLTDYSRSLSAATANSTTEGHYIEVSFWLYSQASTSKTITLADNVAITANDTDPELLEVANAVRLSVFTDPTDAFIFGNDTDFGYTFEPGNEGHSTTASGNDDADFNDLFNRATPLIDEITQELSITGSERVKDIDDESTTPTTLFTIASETPTKVTVKIYVEGWDEQAVNGIITANFDVVLGFRFNE
jgi:hypothetical protein